jgi:hypothetical protein
VCQKTIEVFQMNKCQFPNVQRLYFSLIYFHKPYMRFKLYCKIWRNKLSKSTANLLLGNGVTFFFKVLYHILKKKIICSKKCKQLILEPKAFDKQLQAILKFHVQKNLMYVLEVWLVYQLRGHGHISDHCVRQCSKYNLKLNIIK